MDNIVCSLLISLLLPTDMPSFVLVENSASAYLHLLKNVQMNVHTSSRSLSISLAASKGPEPQLESQVKLNTFLSYLLHDESSFLEAVRKFSGKFLMIYICNFHVLNHLLLIYICKLHWSRRF
jgi:hypothetical protein